MAVQGLVRSFHRTWMVGLLPCIPIALVVGIGAAALGSDWRAALTVNPLDPGPGTALFVTGIAAALAMVTGLALLVSMDYPVGAWVFTLGVSLIAGAAIGFMVVPELPVPA